MSHWLGVTIGENVISFLDLKPCKFDFRFYVDMVLLLAIFGRELHRMTNNKIPKHDKELFIVMNEHGETEFGPTLSQAVSRLEQNYSGNLVRAVKVMVSMAPPAVEDQGHLVTADAASVDIRLMVSDPSSVAA